LDQPGEYKVGGDKDLNVIFDQRTPAHFQFGFDVYSEINKEQGTDPSNRAHQLQFRASSTTVNKFISYKILNEFLKLSIIENTDGVN
jgi:hypothetical protein